MQLKTCLWQMFSCEFYEISKKTFSTEHLRTTASIILPLPNLVNKYILDICKAHNIPIINNDNIIRNGIYKEELRLLRSSMYLLSNNFTENINFLEIYTHHSHAPISILV